MTPTGRVCRIVDFSAARPGEPLEVTLAYEEPGHGAGPRQLGERFTLRQTVARRTLRLIGELSAR
jgi:hypothetical protein